MELYHAVELTKQVGKPQLYEYDQKLGWKNAYPKEGYLVLFTGDKATPEELFMKTGSLVMKYLEHMKRAPDITFISLAPSLDGKNWTVAIVVHMQTEMAAILGVALTGGQEYWDVANQVSVKA